MSTLQKVGIKTASNLNAIDGLRSTFAAISENATLDVKTTDKYKNIGGVGLKFKGGPHEFSVNGKKFKSKVLDDKIEQFTFDKIEGDEVKIKAENAGIEIITVEVYTAGTPVNVPIGFTCRVVSTGPIGRRWECTSGTKTWLAGSSYKYKGLLASEGVLDQTPGNEPTVPIPPPETPSPVPTPTPPAQEGQLGPYPSIGKQLESTQRGPTTRNYASGKPSDETIEKNVKNISYRDHQFITFVTMHEIEHDDNISTKIGGIHMDGNGWFDHGVKFNDGMTCLGNEPKHPSTNSCIVKGPKIGSILEKKVGICATYFADSNHTELWTNTGTGWVKQLEGKDIGGLNPKAKTFECQLRIDGFKKGSVPTIHTAVVQPIAPKN